MPRFVILEHDYPERHWDLMLEVENSLRTWKLLQNPQLLLTQAEESPVRIKANISADHRLMYLDYEGPISNGRGIVERFDRGMFEWMENSAGQVTVKLQGQQLKGILKLTKSEHVEDWQLQLSVSGVID